MPGLIKLLRSQSESSPGTFSVGDTNLKKIQLCFIFSKVADPQSGWCEIRPYCSETWKFLRAAYKCPVFLLSATMEENSINRILGEFSKIIYLVFVCLFVCQLGSVIC